MKKNVNTTKLCPIIQSKLNSNNKDILPIIISYKNNKNMADGKVSSLSNKMSYELPIVNGYACEMSSSAILEMNADPNVEYISYDTRVFAVMDIARKAVGAEQVFKDGYTGKGVTVAIIDTGVSPHNDLIYPTNRIVGFKDFINKETRPYDDNGHGTQVAGLIRQNLSFVF